MPHPHTSLPFSVEMTRERGRLSLSSPVELGPVRVDAMEVSIPRLRLPADLRGGADAFHAHLSEADRVRLTISCADLLREAHREGKTRLRRLELREDTLVAMVTEEDYSLVARWRLLPGAAGEVVLAPLDTLLVGFTRRPWHLLAEGIIEDLGARLSPRREAEGYRVRILPAVLDRLFLAAGWRVPVARLDLVAMGTRSGKLSLEYGPPAALDAVRREVGEGDDAGAEIDRDLLQRLDAARLHQDIDDAIREGNSAGALTMLYRARKDEQEWDPFLQERLVVLQACEPGLHDEALAEAARMIDRGEQDVLARSCHLAVAFRRDDAAGIAEAAYHLGAALVTRGRRGAAAFLMEQAARRLDDGGLRTTLLEQASQLLPRDPGILATRAALLGAEVPLTELLSSLPFMASGAERAALLQAASRRMIADGDLPGALALWDSARGELVIPAELYSAAGEAAKESLPDTRRRLLDWLLRGQVEGALSSEGARALARMGLELLSADELRQISGTLAPGLGAGDDEATRMLALLEASTPPAQLLALRDAMRPHAGAPEPWRNLEFRIQARAGNIDQAWSTLTAGDAVVSPDDATLEFIVGLVGDDATRTRALSEMVRWVERSPDRRRRAAVAGRLGVVLLDDLGLFGDAALYLSLAWQLDEEAGRWLPGLERALDGAGRHKELVELLESALAQGNLPPHEEGRVHRRIGGILGRGLGRWTEALEHLRRARTLLPGAPGPEREFEEATLKAGAEAVAPVPEIASQREAPAPPPAPRSDPRAQLDVACQEAFDLLDSGDVEAARAVAESVLADDPGYGPARDLLEIISDS